MVFFVYTRTVVILLPPLILLLLKHYIPFKFGLVYLFDRCHSTLSKALVLLLFTPIFIKSNSTSSIHLTLSFRVFVLPPGLASNNFMTVLPPSIPATCPSHSDLLTLITATIYEDLNVF
jgi:hypothetical protein